MIITVKHKNIQTMKTINKVLISIIMLVLPGVTFASMPGMEDSGDTIPMVVRDTFPADVRQPEYYYTKWFDDCPNFFPNGGVVDSCLCRFPKFWNFYLDNSVAKWEYTRHHMKVKGLVAMVDRYTPQTAADDSLKLPEYLYLYQLVGRHYALLQDYGIMDGLDLVLVDSVRWDTAAPRVMELRRGWNGEYNQYCYMYEAYFENPVYVDSDFYIFGSTNSNVKRFVGSAYWKYIPTEYVDIMDWGSYFLAPGCEEEDYYKYIHDEFCRIDGEWVGIYDKQTSLGWYTPWPDSPWGYYLTIADQWTLDAVPNDTAYGEVLGGGRWPDSADVTIEAVPSFGYIFYSWSDGSTENPRVIHLTSDTSFTAIFATTERFALSLMTDDEAMGYVSGSGLYPWGADVTVTANPYHEYKFSRWNDGVTDNPRVVHLTSDTAFTAYFIAKEYYTVEAVANNGEWGTVDGGGVYMEGEEATLAVATAPFCLFEGWSDGDWSLPRIVTVTRDTLFTALFSFDSAWAAGIGTAGGLDFTAMPNPTTGHLTVRLDRPGDCEVVLLDMRGRELLRVSSTETSVDLDLSPLPSGQYLLLVTTRERCGVRKVVKK